MKKESHTSYFLELNATSDFNVGDSVLLGRSLALAADDLVEAVADIIGKAEKFTVTVKLNRFARRVKDNLAVLAVREMRAEVHFQNFVDVSVQIVRKLFDHFLTANQGHPR